MNSGYALFRLTVIVSISLFAAGRLLATDLTWDATPGDAINDGSGIWLDPGQWNDGSPNASWSNSTPDNAIIGVGGTAGVITLGAVTAGSVTVTNFTGTYVLTNGNLTVNDTITIATNAGPVSLYTPVSGAAGITKANTGTLLLAGTNSFTGNITINAGTLQIGINGTSATLGGGIYAGNIINNGTLDIQTAASITLSGVISGSGPLKKYTSGNLTLSGANTFRGKVTHGSLSNPGGAGILTVSSFNSVNGGTPLLPSSSLGAPTNVANGTIDLGTGNSSPNPTLRYIGGGETTDRVINLTFNGGASRTLDASGSGLLKFTSPFTGSGASTPSGALILTGTGSGEIEANIPEFYVGSKLTKNGAGTWTLGGKINNTGILTVSAGTLNLDATNATGVSSNTIAVSGGTLNLNATNAISTRPVTISGTGRVNANAPFALGSCAITVTNSATLALTVDLGLMSTNRLTISGTGKVQLDAGVRSTVGSLFFGTNSMAVGVWGSTNSTAGSTSTNFTGTGKLFVGVEIPGGGTVVIVK